ncbi:MAG: fasciclin [Lutibacter sp.]|nr:MAG: fasciclin [Lutibacter sp.]
MKLKYILSAFVFVAFFSCKNDSEKKTNSNSTETKTVKNTHKGQASVELGEGEEPNVLQVAMTYKDKDGNKPFSTLVVAVQAAGVEDALVNTGPLTVFAPVNGAFDKLPEGTVETLLKPENKAKLGFILTNHVAPANYPIKQLKKEAKKGRKLYMASGKYLIVENKDGKMFVGGTEVLMSVKVSNGWIHVIGDVLVPEE